MENAVKPGNMRMAGGRKSFVPWSALAMRLKTAKHLLSIVNEKHLMRNCCMN